MSVTILVVNFGGQMTERKDTILRPIRESSLINDKLNKQVIYFLP